MSANEDGFNPRPDDDDEALFADANDMVSDEPETQHASADSWEEPSQPRPAPPIPPDATFAREAQTEETQPRQEHTIAPGIMIGPGRSGKTTLLLAIGRACHLTNDENLELEFVADKSTGRLMKEATERITGRMAGPNTTR